MERRAHLDAMFEEVDENGDGTLEFGEFLDLQIMPSQDFHPTLCSTCSMLRYSSHQRSGTRDGRRHEGGVCAIAAKFNLVSIGKFDFVDPHAPEKEEIFKIDPKLRMATVISSCTTVWLHLSLSHRSAARAILRLL